MLARVLILLSLSACMLALSASGLTGRLLLPPPATSAETVGVVTPAAPPTRARAVALRPGDTLTGALRREGLDRRTSNDVIAALVEGGADLRRLNPRDTLEITRTLAGDPVAVRWEPSPWLGYAARATEAGWQARRSETRPRVSVAAVQGEVTRSLWETMERAGASPALVVDLVEIFASDFDFTADTRSGDRFRLLVEERYAGDTFVDHGRILVAQYVSDGRVLTGVRWEGRRARAGYYDPDGRSLRKSFLKSPLEFTRITSGFTYARPHPILGGVRPHLAIDYAAPVGTPVRAVADGHVLRAGWNGGNGIQVHLRHRSGYETVYNHLARLGPGLRAGTRVSQRQVVGYVGATGLATGPHLDYRVARHGRFVNPLREKFIPGDPIGAAERDDFRDHARTLVRRLEAAAPF